MFSNIQGVIALLIMARVASCGADGCSVGQVVQPETTGKNGNSSLVSENRAQAIINVTVRQGNTPISGIRIEFSRSIVGQAANYEWSATTDENGHARIEITPGENVSAYYLARAIQNGSQIGSWSSISIKEGYEVMFDLPIGGEAQVTSSSILPNPNITDRGENILLTE